VIRPKPLRTSQRSRPSHLPSNGQVAREMFGEGNAGGPDFSRTKSSLSDSSSEDEAKGGMESQDTGDGELLANIPANDTKSSGINRQSHTTGEPPDARVSSNREDGESDETARSSGMKSSGATDSTNAARAPIIRSSEGQVIQTPRDSPTTNKQTENNGEPIETSNDGFGARKSPNVQQPEIQESKEPEFPDGITAETGNSSDPNKNLVSSNQELCKDIRDTAWTLYISLLKLLMDKPVDEVLEEVSVDEERKDAILAIWHAVQNMCKEFEGTNILPVGTVTWSSHQKEPQSCLSGIMTGVGLVLFGTERAANNRQLNALLTKLRKDLKKCKLPYATK